MANRSKQCQGPRPQAEAIATTLMFRNLPRSYSQHDLVAFLDMHISRSSFDFLYMPQDRKASCNMGYAFVNFINADFARAARAAMERSVWPNDTKARKVKIVLGAVQGLEPNILNYVQHKGEQVDHLRAPLIFINGKEMQLHVELKRTQQRGSSNAAGSTPPFMTGIPNKCRQVDRLRLPSIFTDGSEIQLHVTPKRIQHMDSSDAACFTKFTNTELEPMKIASVVSDSSSCDFLLWDDGTLKTPSVSSTRAPEAVQAWTPPEMSSSTWEVISHTDIIPGYAAARTRVLNLLVELHDLGAF